MRPARALGAWLLVLSGTVGWLLGGATLDLAQGGGLAPWVFTGPFFAWLVIGGFTAVIWGGVRLLR